MPCLRSNLVRTAKRPPIVPPVAVCHFRLLLLFPSASSCSKFFRLVLQKHSRPFKSLFGASCSKKIYSHHFLSELGDKMPSFLSPGTPNAISTILNWFLLAASVLDAVRNCTQSYSGLLNRLLHPCHISA